MKPHFCRSTLEPLKERVYSGKAAGELFPGRKPIGTLPFSRKEFFTEGPKYAAGMSISGVQQKLSLIINEKNEFEMVSVGGEYILKPSPEAFPYAAENEQCAMAISRFVGIDTALSAIIPFADGEYAYFTRRFDRVHGHKLHQEDLAQGFNIPAKSKYEKSYEESLEKVGGMSGGKLSVVRDLFNRIVFAYIIGNNDMHLKNISLIRDKDNFSGFYDYLTPNYDQLFAAAFDNTSIIVYLALDLLVEEKEGNFSKYYNEYGFYSGHDFKELGKRAGLPDKAVQSIFENFFVKEEQIVKMIDRSFMPPEMKAKASAIVCDRIKALRIC